MITISSTIGKIDSTEALKNASSFLTRIMADMRLRRNPAASGPITNGFAIRAANTCRNRLEFKRRLSWIIGKIGH